MEVKRGERDRQRTTSQDSNMGPILGKKNAVGDVRRWRLGGKTE